MGIEKVFGFINTALDWVNELSDQFLEESIEESRTTLTEVEELLSSIGATGKFDKDLKDRDHIWSYAMIIAIVLNGQDLENFGFKDMKENFEDLSSRWEKTKNLMKSLKNDEVNKRYFLGVCNLSAECQIFYDNILQLKNWKSGLFSTRKFKKRIRCYSERLFSVCHSYIFGIDLRDETQKLEHLLEDDD